MENFHQEQFQFLGNDDLLTNRDPEKMQNQALSPLKSNKIAKAELMELTKSNLLIISKDEEIKDQKVLGHLDQEGLGEFEGQSKMSNMTSVETRKKVGDYLFTEREPQFKSSTSKIYLATNRNTGFVAVRVIEKKILPPNLLERFIKEHKSLSEKYGQNEQLVGILDFFQTTSNIYIISQYIREGNLKSYLASKGGILQEKEAIYLGKKILESLATLRNDPLLKKHGNLKLENIFLQNIKNSDPDGAAGEGFIGVVRLSDFAQTYKILKNEKTRGDMDGENDMKTFGIIFINMLFGVLATAYMQTKEGFDKYFSQRTNKISDSMKETLKNCLFDPQFQFQQLEATLQQESKKFLQIKIPLSSLGDNSEVLLGTAHSINKQSVRSMFNSQNPNIIKNFENISKALKEGMTKNKDNLTNEKGGVESKFKKENFLPDLQTKQFPYLKSHNFIMRQKTLEIHFEVMLTTPAAKGADHSNSMSFQTEVKKHSCQFSIYENEFPAYKYQFSLIQEIDLVEWDPYGLQLFFADDSIQTRSNTFRNLDSLDSFVQSNKLSMRVLQNNSNQCYLMKAVIVRDDADFLSVVQEISVIKYIELYLKKLYSSGSTEGRVQGLQASQPGEEEKQGGDRQQKKKMTVNQLRSQKTKTSIASNDIAASSEVFQNFNIIFLRDCFIQKEMNFLVFYLVYDDVEFSLKEYITKNQFPFDENIKSMECAILLNETIEAMKQLNSIGIYHNNLAPENFYFSPMRDVQGNIKQMVLLGNFEEAIIAQPDTDLSFTKYTTLTNNFNRVKNISYKSQSLVSGIINTRSDKEEFVRLNPILQDIYSLGMLLCEVRKGELIYPERVAEIFEHMDAQDFMYQILLTALSEEAIFRRGTIDLLKELRGEKPEQLSMIKAFGLFRFDLKKGEDFSQLDGDLTQIIHSKCNRYLSRLTDSSNILKPLMKKYSGKNKLPNLPPHLASEVYKVQANLKLEFAQLCRDCNELDKSLKNFNEALVILSQNPRANQLDIANILIRTGQVCVENDSKGMVLNLFQNALQLLRKFLGTGHYSMMQLTLHVGDAYLEKGQFQMALHSYQEASILTGSVLGLQGPWGSTLLEKLAVCYYQTSQFENSINFFTRYLTYLKDSDLYQTPRAAQTLNNIGECRRCLSQLHMARENYQQALRILVDFSLQQEHQLIIAQIYNNLGIVYKNQKKLKSALALFEESIRIIQHFLSEQHERALQVLLNIASVFDDLGHHTLASVYYDDIIKQLQDQKNPECLLMAETLHDQALSFYQINDFSQANQIIIQAIQIQSQLLGNFSMSLANSIHNQALINHQLGNYRKAIQLYEDAQRIYAKKLPPDHETIKVLRENQQSTIRFNQ